MEFFLLNALKIVFQIRRLTHMDTMRVFFLKWVYFFQFLKKSKYRNGKLAWNGWNWIVSLYRNCPLGTLLGKGVLKICSKFTGEYPCQSVISIKLQSNFIEITLRHGCSPVNFLHVFRPPFPSLGQFMSYYKRKKISTNSTKIAA